MDTVIRWAVVGTGFIAGWFGMGMREVKDARIAAVASRKRETGEAYAAQYGAERVFTDPVEMLREVKPDIVYVATPNDCHYETIMAALDLGVNVLSEKPIVDNGRQLKNVLDKAREKNLFLMEGMWTRCFPAVRRARAWIEEGRIGRPLTVRASFDIKPEPEDWQVWKGGIAHAGGAIRDVGIYSLAMANLAFPGKPSKVFSTMRSNGEVDHCFRMLLEYPGGTALVGGAFDQVGNSEAEIVGEKGRILIGPEFWHPEYARLVPNEGEPESFEDPYRATGFQYEIMAVGDCLRAGKKECPFYTWDEMVQIADLIESERREWGIVYKSDREG